MSSVSSLPTGTVTFLFTDIEGSTAIWEQHPQHMSSALARHDALLRKAIVDNGGYVFKTVGDAFCAAFSNTLDALNTILATNRNLHDEQWGETGAIGIRAAIHTGIAQERDGDCYGQPLNRVARLMSAGHGGQILLSQPAYELVRDNLPAGVQLRDMGEHRLKDLIRPEHIYQVVIQGLPTEFPPLRTLDYRPNNLPAQPTALIGREKELADIGKLLGREDVRLVTLSGTGGIGKTRLALQAAADLLDEYADGVWFVNLAPVTDPGLVVATIAQALEVKEAGGQPLLDTVKSYLKEKNLLLLIDNFEQVISAATSISELLATCPQLKVLVTSRIALRLRGEREYSVPTLDMPDPKHMPALDTLTQFEAVRLFIERAQGVKADFEVDNDNAPAVAEICARLDGLPLAIELAAARIKTLPPQAMLTRLENRLKMLTGGARDLPARQQTIRNTIEWSYDLLNDGEKQLFRRMAVFQGGRTLEALEVVCNAEALQVEGQMQVDILDGLDSLVGKSLVGQRQGRNGEPRYWMLETIHEFARLKLDESGEGDALARQHALYFMQLADRAEHEILGPNQMEWLDMLEDEHDNITGVLDWVRKQSQTEASGDDEEPHPVDIGLRMMRTLHRFWVYRSYYTEGRMQINTIRNLEAANDGSRERQAARAWAMVSETIFAHRQDDIELSAKLSAAALRIFREVGDKRGIASAILPLALQPSADPDDVRTLLSESKALFEELGDKWNLGRAYFYLGQYEHVVGKYDLSLELYSKGLALMQEVGTSQASPIYMFNSAMWHGVRGSTPMHRPTWRTG